MLAAYLRLQYIFKIFLLKIDFTRSPDRLGYTGMKNKYMIGVEIIEVASCDFAASGSAVFTESSEIDRGGAGTDRPIGIIGW